MKRAAPLRRVIVELASLALAALVFCLAVTGGGRGPVAPADGAGVQSAFLSPRWALPLDDAYIFIRYAHQAARGRPLEWSDGEISTGASSFLYPWLLLPGQWLFDDLAGWSIWSRWVGTLSLFLAGAAAAFVLRSARLRAPWPLAGGLALIFSGAVGYGALAGMESALNAAAILTAAALCVQLQRQDRSVETPPRLAAAAVACCALLPWIRPENMVLALAASAFLGLGSKPPLRRFAALLIPLPGAALMLLYGVSTGQPLGAGTITKSILSTPYATAGLLARLGSLNWKLGLGPLYAGFKPHLLAPGLGVLAIAGAFLAMRSRYREWRPLAVAWLLLLLLAPFSTILMWQYARHHHAGIACAVVLATAAMATAIESYAPRLRWLALILPLALFLGLPYWRSVYRETATNIVHRHGPVVAWLERHARNEVLVLNDAGLPALAHDGPMIDVMGLGTADLSKPHRHGAGAVLEALARRPRLPTLAAVNLDVFSVPQILGESLLPGLDPRTQTLLARVRTDRLQRTALVSPGVDFADLASETRAGLRWDPDPLPLEASLALVLPDSEGPTAQGCRPLRGAVTLDVPPGSRPILRATSLGRGPSVVLAVVSPPGGGPAREIDLPSGGWSDVALGTSLGGLLRIELLSGSPACLESVSWPGPRAGTGG